MRNKTSQSDQTHLTHGKLGEDAAVFWLEKQGYTIKARNVFYRVGEIDIIAEKNSILCFVEVRSRKNNAFDRPESSIRSSKKEKLIKAASLYLKKVYRKIPACRFDVIAVTGYGKDAKILHIPHAFDLSVCSKKRGNNPWQAF